MLRRNLDAYFSNPTALRDFRTSLRGSRALWLWGLYLGFLVLIALSVYASIAYRGVVSVSDIQSQLGGFYAGMMGLLGGLITLITPTMTAGSIAQERQRRSLDLVITAPIDTKAYLVGKMLSAYRYTWLLLILSLPMSATAIVLGGATWSDVLQAYVLLSMLGVAFSSIGLLMSAVAPKPITAVVWTYGALVVFSVLSGILSSLGLYSTIGRMRGFSLVPQEMAFYAALNPFTVGMTANSYMTIYGHHVPNWFLVGLFSLLMSKIMLLGAASHLSSYGSKETRSLRIHGLLYSGLVSGLISCGLASMGMFFRAGRSASTLPWTTISAYVVAWCIVIVSLLFPLLTTFGGDAERKFRPDGSFRLRNAFVGTPSGSLPYVLLLWLFMVAGALIGGWWRTGSMPFKGITFPSICLYALGYTLFFWGVGRFVSAYSPNLRTARSMMFSIMMVMLVIPWPVLAIIDGMQRWAGGGPSGLWMLFILTPLTTILPQITDPIRMFAALLLAACGALLGILAEARLAKMPTPLGAL